MKNVIIIVAVFIGLSSSCLAQENKEKPKIDTQKVEIKKGNNCPIPCNKNCTKDPNKCAKVIKSMQKQINKNDTSKIDTTKQNTKK